MKILELFAGSKSIGNVAKELGFKVFSSDIEQFGGIDYLTDILNFDYKKLPFVPDVIWASPPCTGFSIASVSHHWVRFSENEFIPKSETAKLGLKLLTKTLEIIGHYQELNPSLIWFIENPRGMMRKMPYMQKAYMLPRRRTVSYCQYGDSRMKPTDIWTNAKWFPKPMCKNGDKCHISAPRGSKTGTQGLKGSFDRSKIPRELCEEILKAISDY